ncbi:MAG: DUF2237 family protein [Candidatus Puniceispirillaceae bacterium]
MDGESFHHERQYNVLGSVLISCSTSPMTGFYRDGCCATGPEDRGLHTVCALMDEAFLQFSKQAGNDLITPRPEFGFAGLKPGDYWCLCAGRWEEARQAGKAPRLRLAATNRVTLAIIPLEILESYAIDKPV